MTERTDVFVIGGGPAGLAAALAVRKRGMKVTLADGAEPPIDKPCGEGLMPDTMAALGELGVRIDEREGYVFRGIRFTDGEREVYGDLPNGPGLGVRRLILHGRMVKRAREAGVTLLWRTAVSGLCEAGVVVGNRVIEARWVVGADGIRSRVRKWAGLDSRGKQEKRYAFRRHFRIKPWSEYMEIFWGENAQAYVTPVGEREVCVAVISRNPGRRLASMDVEFPELGTRLRGAEFAGTERGAITVTRRLRRVQNGKVALLGDASGSVDAITGEGLNLSFRQALALADAIAAGDLRRYEQEHRKLGSHPAMMGRLLLLLDGHSGIRKRTMQALAGHPENFRRLLEFHVGATSAARAAATGALLGWRVLAA